MDDFSLMENIWIIPAIPFVSFWLILFFGKRLPGKGHEIGILSVSAAFVLACAVGMQWIDHVDSAEHGTESSATSEEHSDQGHAESGEEGALAPAAGEFAAVGLESEQSESDQAAADEGAEDHASEDPATGDPATGDPATEEPATEDHGGEEAGAEGHGASLEPISRQVVWLQSGGHEIKAGTMLDGLTAMMLFVVTFISLLVHIFSTDYVHGDRRYTHYFAFLSLFTSSMLLFVMSDNTLQMLVGWELVGVCSFALIGHWWEEKANSDAALKAFLTNRVGDMGLIIGVSILFLEAGTFDVVKINQMAIAGDLSHLVLLVSASSLIAAVMSKSGQFFLHTWLPDAMAGPTPVSALIHAATMVVAGIFMVARLYGVFWHGLSIGTSNINLLALVGGTTTLVGGSLAFVQKDIKKVLAYSTVSQLGYMVMALGVGAWTAAMFHLFTHAFFKACLFLGAGSLSHACHHSFNMVDDMGGLRKRMPITHATFLVGTLALAGIAPLSGFWSKDEILAGALSNGDGGYPVMLVMGLITAFLTAAYMGRAYYYAFLGEYRGGHAHHAHADDAHANDAHASDAHADDAHGHGGEPHESGPRLTVPLVVLASLAVVAGFANLPGSGPFESIPSNLAHRFQHYVEPTGSYFPAVTHAEFDMGLAVGSTILAVGGLVAAYLFFVRQLGPHGLSERNALARGGRRLLENKYYLDHLYTDIIAGGTKGPVARGANWVNQNIIDGVVNLMGVGSRRLGVLVYKHIDQKIVDGAVNSSAAGAGASGEGLRRIQTGKVQQYGALLFIATAFLAGVFVVII